MRLLPVLLLLTGILTAGPADEMQAVIDRYEKVHSLSGAYTLTICSEDLGYCRTFEGSFAMARPDKFRFTTSSPERQVVVGDGAATWFFWPDSILVRKSAYVGNPLSEILLNPANAGLRAESLSTEYGETVIHLVSSDSLPGFSTLQLTLEPKTRNIRVIAIDDGMGGKLHYALSDVRYNPTLPESTFRFTPPKGAVVEE